MDRPPAISGHGGYLSSNPARRRPLRGHGRCLFHVAGPTPGAGQWTARTAGGQKNARSGRASGGAAIRGDMQQMQEWAPPRSLLRGRQMGAA
ncbi:hypothetical protein GGTG_10354 [Gaeumannomyces tritici R3-111a-1]|uniref:Uncharacterized protein n=1 Tax=Gaeumannomyces tritici (strain R3-111a-1) TaxID=644352 RepID=J3PA31_GAET3|nr:hypothetical protein GGTG_10354 [Gaeumannomyces tritici R3-111a-1]EJT73517.1 hypothetical protein GGTG_10354 [Gaeumannomyces tritici R3-111a-1]